MWGGGSFIFESGTALTHSTHTMNVCPFCLKSLPGLDMEYHPIAWSRTNVLQFEELLDAEHADISCRAKALGPRAFALQILPDGH